MSPIDSIILLCRLSNQQRTRSVGAREAIRGIDPRLAAVLSAYVAVTDLMKFTDGAARLIDQFDQILCSRDGTTKPIGRLYDGKIDFNSSGRYGLGDR